MKAAQDIAPREKTTGKYVNQPIPVADDLAAIIKAIGGEAAGIKTIRAAPGDLPVSEY
jgi:hypothetical protein